MCHLIFLDFGPCVMGEATGEFAIYSGIFVVVVICLNAFMLYAHAPLHCVRVSPPDPISTLPWT